MYKLGCGLLMITAALLIVIGVYAIFFNATALFYPLDWLMDPYFWKNETLSGGTRKFKIFTWDLLGMFHVLWGVNLLYIVGYGLKRMEPWAWRCIVIQVVVWLFVVAYLTLSIRRGDFLPVTLFFAVLFIIPLIMTRGVLTVKAGQ